MMKFSIVNTGKEGQKRLTVKPVEWFMERIRTDTKGGAISKLRDHIADFGDNDELESSMPVAMVYPSVELKKTANGNLDIVAFNSLIVLHVGNLLRPEDIQQVKEASMMLPMTFAAFAGADGRSVEVLVSVALQEAGRQLTTEWEMDAFCKVAYEKACGAYGGILPHPIEYQTVTARSSFRMTLDEAPFYHPEATPLLVSALLPFTREKPTVEESDEQREVDMDLYAVYEQMYERAAEEAYEATRDVIPSQHFHAYITELARRLCAVGLPEEEAFVHLRNHHMYKNRYDEDTFRSIVSAVYAEYKPARMVAEETVSQETRRFIRHLTTRYVFRYNTVMGYTEYRPNSTWAEDWQPCDENAINGMAIQARLANIDVRDKDVRRYVRSNMIRQSNPVDDYMQRVSKAWDGKTDHIAMLARCIHCDVPQWEKWFKKWFLAMVAQWLLPQQEYGNAIVPLLISPQGDGKTSFCRMILPRELRWGFLENLDVGEKRTTLQSMHNFLLINLDEFNAISQKLQEGFLKNIIQLPSVKIKRPYGKHVEEFKRYASFIATTNETKVLGDPTGSRRFICVPLTAPVDTSYKPNYDALYGQAYTMVTQRQMDWWFGTDEVKAITEHNQQFQITPPAMLYFNEYYEAVDDEKEGEWVSPTAIYDHLRHIAGSSLKATGVASFGRLLRSLPGLQSRRVGTGRLYLVRRKKPS